MTRVVLLATLGLMAFHGLGRADGPLNEQQLLRLFPGTFEAVVQGKYQLKVVVFGDGAIVGEIPGLQDHGRWTVRDNEFCIVLPNWTRGRIECSTLVAENGWYRGRNVIFRKL